LNRRWILGTGGRCGNIGNGIRTTLPNATANRYFRGVIFRKLARAATLEANPFVDSASFRRMNFAFPVFLKAASVLRSFERPRARYEHKLAF
jgi:hypothetical protein